MMRCSYHAGPTVALKAVQVAAVLDHMLASTKPRKKVAAAHVVDMALVTLAEGRK